MISNVTALSNMTVDVEQDLFFNEDYSIFVNTFDSNQFNVDVDSVDIDLLNTSKISYKILSNKRVLLGVTEIKLNMINFKDQDTRNLSVLVSAKKESVVLYETVYLNIKEKNEMRLMYDKIVNKINFFKTEINNNNFNFLFELFIFLIALIAVITVLILILAVIDK